MDLPPVNLITKAASWLWQRLTKLLFYKTYFESHRRWHSRHQLGSRWQPLGDHLEYSLRLAQPIDHRPHVSRLAFRSTGQILAKVDFYFDARGAGLRYQERISACKVDQTPIIWNLQNVPVLEFLSTPPTGIAFSVEEFKLRHCVVKLSNGEVLPPCDSPHSNLTHSWLLNDTWVYRWSHWWNCNSIKFAKEELAMYWRWRFGLPGFRVYSPYARGTHRRPVLQSILRGLGLLMALPPLVTSQFWLAIWSGLFMMDRDDRLRFKWRTDKTDETDPI